MNERSRDIFRGLEASKNAGLMFLKTKREHEGKCEAFRGNKHRSKECLVYLEVKLHQQRCG